MGEKKLYKVKVTETLDKTVLVWADDEIRAEEIADLNVTLDYDDLDERDVTCLRETGAEDMEFYDEIYGCDYEGEE